MITKVIKVTEKSPELLEAADIIRQGGLVIFPTETVYGLGTNALDSDAAQKIYSAKGRPSDNPLIVHIAFPSDAARYADDENYGIYEKIADHFMPGPITVIMKKKPIIPDSVTGGLDSVALRCPIDPVAHELIRLSGVPIAAPSANISGRPSPTKSEHCIDDMDGRVDMILDGGECEVGVESTIVSVLEGKVRLLRPGGVTLEELESVCGRVEVDPAILRKMKDDEHPLAPGMKYRHYAPKAPIWAVAGAEENIKDFLKARFLEGHGILCYEEDLPLFGESDRVVSFGKREDFGEQAHLIFNALREFDRISGLDEIYCRMPSFDGIGFAVRNRLTKACGFQEIDLDKTMVLGICGSIGSGKSTVSETLADCGAVHIDCDAVYSSLVDNPSDCLDAIENSFPGTVKDGKLDRPAMSRIVFSDPDARIRLNSVTHPFISSKVDRMILDARKSGARLIAVEAPLLFESGFDKKCDKILGVVAQEKIKLERIAERDGMSTVDAKARLAGQLFDSELIERCDMVIENNGDASSLETAVKKLYGELTNDGKE